MKSSRFFSFPLFSCQNKVENCRCTADVRHCDTEQGVMLQRFQAGKALRHLLPRGARSKVFDEVCVELAMALLQLLAWAPPEELLWRATRALARFAAHSHDVPQLIAMVGPDPAAFRGTSPRVDEQIDLIMKRVK